MGKSTQILVYDECQYFSVEFNTTYHCTYGIFAVVLKFVKRKSWVAGW